MGGEGRGSKNDCKLVVAVSKRRIFFLRNKVGVRAKRAEATFS
jgi:hypothetical protein